MNLFIIYKNKFYNYNLKINIIIHTTNRNKFNFFFFKKIINEEYNKIKNENKIVNNIENN